MKYFMMLLALLMFAGCATTWKNCRILDNGREVCDGQVEHPIPMNPKTFY